MTLESTGNSNEPSPVSRRTMLRGTAATAATVWTASAITMVTATPAHAASADLKLAFSVARYVNNTTELQANVDPTRLELVGTYGNQGPQTTQNFQITLSIPANLYATLPTATTPTGFDAPSISPIGGNGFNNGWTLVYTRTSQLAPGTVNQAFNTTISFTDGANPPTWSDSPFRRWAGTQFTLSATATATNGTPAADAPTIAATPNGTFAGRDARIYWSPLVIPIGVNARLSRVWNNGRSTIGQVKLRVEIKKLQSGRLRDGFETDVNFYGNTGSHASGWTFLRSNVGGNNDSNTDENWYWEFQNKRLAWAPSSASDAVDGPKDDEAFHVHFPVRSDNIFLSADFGPRRFIFSADRAVTRSVDGDIGDVNWS